MQVIYGCTQFTCAFTYECLMQVSMSVRMSLCSVCVVVFKYVATCIGEVKP